MTSEIEKKSNVGIRDLYDQNLVPVIDTNKDKVVAVAVEGLSYAVEQSLASGVKGLASNVVKDYSPHAAEVSVRSAPELGQVAGQVVRGSIGEKIVTSGFDSSVSACEVVADRSDLASSNWCKLM